MGASVVVYEDSRQRSGKHVNKQRWWKTHGVEVERRKLSFGDYAVDGSNIVIDTKRSITEVAKNCGHDHARFVREMERARDAGYRLVILIEVPNYTSIDDVYKWVSKACRDYCPRWRARTCNPFVSTGCTKYKRKPMQGPTLAKIMLRLESDYGCRFEFCHPARSARRICELLGVDYE